MTADFGQRKRRVNAHFASAPREVRVWLRLVRGSGFMEDLDIRPAAPLDGMPDWLTDDLLAQGEITHALSPPHHGLGDGWATWAAEHGIAPGDMPMALAALPAVEVAA